MTKFTLSVAYIGLGNMGRAMAKNIATKADLPKPLLVFNRSPAKAEKLVQELPSGRAQVANSIDEAVSESDIVFLSLGDDDAVSGTVDAILKNDVTNKVIVDCSTIAKESTAKIARQIQAAGADFVACPVCGSPLMAEEAKIVCLLAGPAASVDKILPLTTGVMSRDVIPFRDQPSEVASAMKCIANSVLFNAVQAAAEGQVLAQQSGVGSEAYMKFINLFWAPMTPYSGRMLNTVYYTSEHPPFSVDHARKDIRFALALAKENNVPLKALEVTDSGYAAVQKHMDGEKADVSALFGAVRLASGLSFEA